MKFLGERRLREIRRKLFRHDTGLGPKDRLDPESITALQDEIEKLEEQKEKFFELKKGIKDE
jgi:hypothetical protein